MIPTAAPGAVRSSGSAEVIPLPDAYADVVTRAQAFHWFEHDVALPEIARVLSPGGSLALVWNTRDDREPWVARLSETIGSETIERGDADVPIAASGLFEPVEQEQFAWAQRLDRATLRDLVISRSYCAVRPLAEREAILAEVATLFDEHASGGELRAAVRDRVLPRHEERSGLMVERLPRRLLHVEGLAVLAGSLVLYFQLDFGWLLLVVLFLAPDLSAVGYLRSPAVGAVTYDAVHTYVGPIALALIGILGDRSTATQIALIWAAHIGMDRALGYGLKYPTAFKDTHLQRV